MNTGTRNSSPRLWPKLLAIFGGAFLFFLAAFVVMDLFSSYAERWAITAQVGNQPAPIVIDPKIADELAKVLAANEMETAVVDMRDPFIDRAALSGTVGGLGVTQASASSSNSGGTPAKINVGGGGTQTVVVPPPVASTLDRYQDWLVQAAGNPDMKLDPRIFAVHDLLPVGIVDGGNGPQEVMFVSESAGKSFSFPVGTMFFDGWLTEVRPEGVVFSFNDGKGTIRMRSWTRSIGKSGA